MKYLGTAHKYNVYMKLQAFSWPISFFKFNDGANISFKYYGASVEMYMTLH